MAGENINPTENETVEDKDEKVLPKPGESEGTPPVDDTETPVEDPKEDPNTGDAADDPKTGEEDQPTDYDKEVWGSTGDEVGDSVLKLLSDSGMTTDDAKALLFDPVKSGDPTKIDRDALVEKVGKAQANLILAGIENYVGREAKKAEVAVKAVHDAAGGKEAWDTILPWLNSKAVSEDARAEYRELIDKGGKSAELAVRDIVTKYNADPNNKALGKREVIGDSRSNTEPKGISQAEYGNKLILLQKQGKATDKARAELLALRRLGRKQGI